MSAYIACLVYDQSGEFQGYCIRKEGVVKLQSTNLYLESEIAELDVQLGRLNEDAGLKAHWPSPKDPDVVAILDNPDFMPLEYADQQVIDEANSYIVYQEVAGTDDDGNPGW